jgi:hypothetical protein
MLQATQPAVCDQCVAALLRHWYSMLHAAAMQACASTTIINYAPSLLEISGMQRHGDSILYSSGVGIGKVSCCLTSGVQYGRPATSQPFTSTIGG